ncbi:MAG: OmpH family outer membrane protein, partial [Bryobacteraceae bacterium]
IGVIQAQSALLSTKDGQKAQADFQIKLEPKKKELEQKAADIRALQDKLQRGGPAMADTARDSLTRQIDDQTKRYNRDMQDAQDEGQEEQRKLLDELTGKMMQVIDKYAQANGYSIIIDVTSQNTPVLYASNTVDITKDVIELYDKTMSGTSASPASAGPASATPARRPAAPAPAPVRK